MKGIIKKIDQINFGLMSPEQIREMSVVKIEIKNIVQFVGM